MFSLKLKIFKQNRRTQKSCEVGVPWNVPEWTHLLPIFYFLFLFEIWFSASISNFLTVFQFQFLTIFRLSIRKEKLIIFQYPHRCEWRVSFQKWENLQWKNMQLSGKSLSNRKVFSKIFVKLKHGKNCEEKTLTKSKMEIKLLMNWLSKTIITNRSSSSWWK